MIDVVSDIVVKDCYFSYVVVIDVILSSLMYLFCVLVLLLTLS